MLRILYPLLAILFTVVAGLAIALLIFTYGLVVNLQLEITWRDEAGVEDAWLWWFRFARYPFAVAAVSIVLAGFAQHLQRGRDGTRPIAKPSMPHYGIAEDEL